MVEKEHILKIDDNWEPFVRIGISNQDFLAYSDIGSMVSTMPKVVHDSLRLDLEKIHLIMKMLMVIFLKSRER